MPTVSSSPTGVVPLDGFPVYVRSNSLVVIIDTTLFNLSSSNIVLGGQPLSLAYYNGYYALAVVSVAGARISDQFVYKSQFFTPLETTYGNAFPMIVDVGSSVPVYAFTWSGIPIALNEENKMVVIEQYIEQIDETNTFDLGGYPLTACRSGDRWYLFVSPGATAL